MGNEISLLRRMQGVLVFDVDVYEEVEHDPRATWQAALVVALATAAQALGSLATGPVEMVRAAAGALGGWAVFAGLAWLIGARLFRGEATWGEVWRTIGFAQTPALLAALAWVPLVGWLVEAVVVLWVLWASVVALRAALDIDTLRAVVTGILAGAAWAVLALLF